MASRRPYLAAPLPAGLRWVAPNSSALGDCRDGHLALDDGRSGTLCGRAHGGSTRYGPQRLADGCGNCLRIARARHGLAS